MAFRHLDLFSGIGGFALAASWVWPDHEVVAFCEIDPFCQKVLRKHWPDTPIIPDVRDINAETIANAMWGVAGIDTGTNNGAEKEIRWNHAGDVSGRCNELAVDLLTGGFPCQPFSHAGKRKGTSDNRHLWPEMFRVISELHPRWVIGENVRGLLTIENGLVFERCCLDLESAGYEVQPFVIPACAVNAPHRRDRVWILAHAKDTGSVGRRGRGDGDTTGMRRALQTAGPNRHAADTADNGCDRNDTAGRMAGEQSQNKEQSGDRWTGWSEGRNWSEPWLEAATRLCSLDDGVPRKLVRPGWRVNALKAAGNAIVPQVAEKIMQAIKHTEEGRKKYGGK